MTVERSPERQRLAEAIERVTGIEAAIADVAAAHLRTGDASELDAAIRDAERDIAGAHAREPARLVDEALGRPVSSLPSIGDAEAKLTELRDEAERRRSVRQLLRQEEATLDTRLSYAVRSRNEAIAAVLATDPAITNLFAELIAARATVARIENAFHALNGAPALRDLASVPSDWSRWDRLEARNAPELVDAVAAWSAAPGLLATDPDAALPGSD